MFQTLVIVLLFCFAAGCPEVSVPPCSCRLIGFHAKIITCVGAENEMVLEKSMQPMRKSTLPIRSIEIFDSTLNYLPSKLFRGMHVERLFIAGSSMVSLSDADSGFVGLENSLETLVVQDCNLYNGWKWSHLKHLNSLTELRTIKAGPLEVDEDIKEIAHLNITNLFFTQDSISYLHDTAFSTFHNLDSLSLKMNHIKVLKRSMFPNPANNLRQIIFSHNKVEVIPSDLFINMPSLISIILSHNKILTVDKLTFLPVWNHLKKFDLASNPLRCDCRLRWVLDHRFPLNTWSTCEEPIFLKGKSIKDLQLNDLWC